MTPSWSPSSTSAGSPPKRHAKAPAGHSDAATVTGDDPEAKRMTACGQREPTRALRVPVRARRQVFTHGRRETQIATTRDTPSDEARVRNALGIDTGPDSRRAFLGPEALAAPCCQLSRAIAIRADSPVGGQNATDGPPGSLVPPGSGIKLGRSFVGALDNEGRC